MPQALLKCSFMLVRGCAAWEQCKFDRQQQVEPSCATLCQICCVCLCRCAAGKDDPIPQCCGDGVHCRVHHHTVPAAAQGRSHHICHCKHAQPCLYTMTCFSVTSSTQFGHSSSTSDVHALFFSLLLLFVVVRLLPLLLVFLKFLLLLLSSSSSSPPPPLCCTVHHSLALHDSATGQGPSLRHSLHHKDNGETHCADVMPC